MSIVSALVGAGILGVLAMGIMRISKVGVDTQVRSESGVDYVNFERKIDSFLIQEPRCTGSFQGLTFNGSTINNAGSEVIFELYKVDSSGTRGDVVFSVLTGNPAHEQFNRLKITNMTFTMPDHSSGTNFGLGYTTAQIELVITGEKKISAKQIRNFRPIKRTLNIGFNTDVSGLSTIDTCSLAGVVDPNETPWEQIATGADRSVAPGEKLLVNTSGGEVTLTLPINPQLGDTISFMDHVGTFDTNNLVISIPAGSGQRVMDAPVEEELRVDMKGISFSLMYTPSGGWRIR